MRVRCFIIVFAALFVQPLCAAAQTTTFVGWLHERLALVTASAAAGVPEGKQVETPSIASESTALVDASSAPDLIGIATQFFKLGTADDGAPMSVTLSGFAVRTAVRGEDPMRPSVYAAGRNWRRVSVTFGRQTQGEDGQPDVAQLIGGKVLLYDRRDPTHPKVVEKIQAALPKDQSVVAATKLQRLYELLLELLGKRVGAANAVDLAANHLTESRAGITLALLTPDDLAKVDELLRDEIAPALTAIAKEQAEIVKELRQAPQISISYQAKLRRDDGDNEHAWQAIVDYGFAPRFSISANVALLRIDHAIAGNEMDWKVSAEGRLMLTRGPTTLLDTGRPLMLSGSFAATRHTGRPNTRKGQIKLTVPLALGMSLPLSVTVANRSDLISETDVRGHVGFTIDFSALQRVLRAPGR